MAHKKGVGSSKNGRESASKRRFFVSIITHIGRLPPIRFSAESMLQIRDRKSVV